MMLSACASAPRTSAEARANPRELSSREQALHVLNRLSFGPRPGDVDRVLATGVDRWIDRQLQPERIPDPALDALLKAYPVLRMSANELAEEFPPPGAALRQARQRGDTALAKGKRVELARASRSIVGEITSARVARASVSERQLQEVMTDFWLNHFTVFVGKGQLRYTLPDYERESIRPFVFGRFRDLLGAVARSPAMLQYLDNVQSVADSGRRVSESRRVARRDRQARSRQRGLNENYARELLELHTLGVDGGYTQQDVIDVARALTGWTVGPPRIGTQGFVFNPAAHDAEEKLVLGHRLPAGRGIEDGEEVLDILARHPSTARFISRKLAIRFVSDAPSDELVDLAADVFRRSDGDIREVVRAIVTSSEFFSRAAYRAKVKSPFEVVVSALRAVDARPDTTPRTAAVVAQLGQPIYGHQAPNGWPETSEPWMNTGAILSRINFGLALAAGRVPGASLRQWPAFDTLSRRSAKEQVAGVVEAFLGGVVSAETRDVLESGVNPLLARAGTDSTFAIMEPDSVASASSAARERRRRVAGTAGAPVRLSGLSQTVGLALGSPEFQRR
ncbi:MAG: hypothetical protein MNPFHGCM_01845 [Gemmatimonadaceae bacterium]|nr:hypothetical protein [Gemmatimonadaceae bacterium]